MRHFQYILLLFALLVGTAAGAQTLSDEAQVSLLSCSPGKPLYFRYGHSAIRIQDPSYTDPSGHVQAIDWVFNYGLFDFNDHNFYLKFVRGETDYMLGLEDMKYFHYTAAYYDRTISYQPLLLTQEDKQQIFNKLAENYRPENRYYRYNFVYDNCATRPWHLIRNAMNLPEAEGMSGITWRQACDHYSGKWTWGKYGINLLFGYESDREMTKEESLFLPENLMNYVSEQGLTDNEFITPFIARDGLFRTSPEFYTLLLAALLIILTLAGANQHKMIWWVDCVMFILFAVLGLIIFILYFFSCHPFVGSNMLILFLNPLWLIPCVMCTKKKWRQSMLLVWPVVAAVQAVCLIPYLYVGQTLHPILILIFTQHFRLYYLGKKCKKNLSKTPE